MQLNALLVLTINGVSCRAKLTVLEPVKLAKRAAHRSKVSMISSSQHLLPGVPFKIRFTTVGALMTSLAFQGEMSRLASNGHTLEIGPVQ